MVEIFAGIINFFSVCHLVALNVLKSFSLSSSVWMNPL